MRRLFVSLSALGLLSAALGCHHTAEMCCDSSASAPAPLDLSQGRDLYPWSSSGQAADAPGHPPEPGYLLDAPTPLPPPPSVPPAPPSVSPVPTIQPPPDENAGQAPATLPAPGAYHNALFAETPPLSLVGEPEKSRANSSSNDGAKGFPLLKW